MRNDTAAVKRPPSPPSPRGTLDALPWIRDLDLDAALKSLLYALASRIGHDNACYPSQALLARDAGMAERTVRRHLAALEGLGLIRRTARMREEGKGRTSDRITLLIGSAPLDQPANLTGPVDDADQPANYDTYEPDQPANHDRPTGQIVHDQPASGGRGSSQRTIQRTTPPNTRGSAEGAAGGGEDLNRMVAQATRAAAEQIAAALERNDGPYIEGITNRLRRQHADDLRAIATNGADMDELVAHLLDLEKPPPPATPLDGTVAAQHERMRLNEARAAGAVCQVCEGSGVYLDANNVAQDCECKWRESA